MSSSNYSALYFKLSGSALRGGGMFFRWAAALLYGTVGYCTVAARLTTGTYQWYRSAPHFRRRRGRLSGTLLMVTMISQRSIVYTQDA